MKKKCRCLRMYRIDINANYRKKITSLSFESILSSMKSKFRENWNGVRSSVLSFLDSHKPVPLEFMFKLRP